MVRITLIGAGAIGCSAGAALKEIYRNDLLVFAHQTFDCFVVKTKGFEDCIYPVSVITSDFNYSPVDWVFLCVKAHQTPSTANLLRSIVGPHTKVAVFQNGVEHREHVTQFLPNGTVVVPVIVELPAERLAPGVVALKKPGHFFVANDPVGCEFTTLFASKFVKAETTDDFKTCAWRKLCLNAANGAILALTGQKMGVMRKPGVIDVARMLIKECIAVGRAEGAQLDDTLLDQLTERFLNHEDSGNSMYYDLIAGRELEWDARNGVIVRLGIKHGIETPINAAFVPLLRALGPKK